MTTDKTEKISLKELYGETLIMWISRHIGWSRNTFGEGSHTVGLLKHIRKECGELEDATQYANAHPGKENEHKVLLEVIDIIILATDLAYRLGFDAEQITCAMIEKQRVNMEREYPKITNPNEPTEHIRDE